MSTSSEHAFAVVESVEADGLRLKFDGEAAAGEKTYKCNTFFKFSVGDRVYCVKDSGTFVAICKIGAPATRIVADDANVSYVPRAGKATRATYAEQLEDYMGGSGGFWVRFDTSNVPYFRGPYSSSGEIPLLSVLDYSADTYNANRYIIFRSDYNGKLQYQAPYRSATWYTLSNA